MRLRNWIIRRLGGYTREQWQDREHWSKELVRWIDQNRDFVLMDDYATALYREFDVPVLISGKSVDMLGCRITTDGPTAVYLAPWTVGSSVTNCHFSSTDAFKAVYPLEYI